MIIPNTATLDDSFLQKRFANKYLGDARTLRIGNIVSFISPVNITNTSDNKPHISDEAISFCIEIPDISTYAGVCFQKLFITNTANILAGKYFDAEIEIINNDIIIKKDHENGGIHQRDGIVSINTIKDVNGAILIYLGLHNKAGNDSLPRSFSLNLKPDQCSTFMDSVNECFYTLANSIFLNTTKM